MDKLNLEATCPKCWADADRIRVDYVPATHFAVPSWQSSLTDEPQKVHAFPAYMKRTCGRCSYIWNEAPLDTEDAKAGEATPDDPFNVWIGGTPTGMIDDRA